MLVTSRDRMARDDYSTTLMGESGVSREWRDGNSRPKAKTEFIHSGHFMVSDPFKGEEKSKNSDRRPPGYDFGKYATAGTSENYKFNQTDLEIDSSFAKLFECLNLAYTGCKIVSPKWKTFKGQKVSLQDKIRLNNAIWREWHNQFIIGKKPFLCHFSLPLLDNEYKAPTAVVLEGKYGKRTTTAVVGEYQKWRAFYLKQKRRHSKHGEAMDWSQITSLADRDFFAATGQVPMVLDEDALLSEFSDTLFSSLNQSFIFPNPREFSHAGVSVDAIQPGLVGLQPPLDELMDTLDGLPEIRTTQQSSQIQSAPFVFTAGDQSTTYQDPATSQSLPQQQESQRVSAVNNNLNQVLLANALLSQTDPVESEDLSSILVTQQQQQQQPQHSLLQSSVRTLPQAAPQQHAVLTQQQQQQQQPATSTFTLTPQLLGQLLQAQLQQQQQQQQQQVDQKNTTVLNLNSALLSSLGVNQTSNFSGSSLQNTNNLLQSQQQQQQQPNFSQATSISLQQAVATSQGINQQQQFTAVPVKITRAVDIDGLGNQNQNQQGTVAGSSTIQIQNSQSRIVITPQIQQQQSLSSSTALLDSDQLQLLQQQQQQQQQQTMLQQPQQNVVTPKLEQSNYMQDLNIGSVQATNQDLLLSGMTGVPSPAPVERRTEDQTQALKLLQKVASHVSQTNTNNWRLFTPEQTSIFNRIFAENAEQQGQNVLKQQQSKPQTQQNKVASGTAGKQPQSAPRTVIFQTPPSTGGSAMGASRTVQKDSVVKAKPKQTLGKKPIMKASSSSSGSGANSSSARTCNRTLLTHLLTGGKYDPTSGIVLTASPAKSPSTASSSTVSNVVLTTIKTDLSQPSGSHSTVTAASHILDSSKASVLTTPGSAARVVSVTSSPTGAQRTSDPTLFTIGASTFTSPDSKAEGNDSSDDKKNITAEQKRRTNIRCGFETLHQLIPSISQNPNTKVSKAAMLQKGVDYIKKLQAEKNQLSEEMRLLKEEINTLNVAISESQSQLPASGVPVTRQRYDQMRDSFDEYVRERTEQNWKFWIFSIIIRPLFESFNGTVSIANREELCRTVLSWLDRHCSLLALRPTVLSSLTLLSRITSILSDPAQVPQQAVQAVHKRDRANSAE